MQVWLQLNTKKIRICKHMLRSNIMSCYSGLKGMLPFKNKMNITIQDPWRLLGVDL